MKDGTTDVGLKAVRLRRVAQVKLKNPTTMIKYLYYLVAVMAIAIGLFGILLVIGEPTQGSWFDSVPGILMMKIAGVGCCYASYWIFKKVL